IYQITNVHSLNSNIDAPEEIRYQGISVPSVSGIPTAPGQWFYSAAADTLYLWLPDSSNPQANWRPLMEEIVQLIPQGSSWTWRRLAHHRSQYNGWTTGPRGNPDPTGSYVL